MKSIYSFIGGVGSIHRIDINEQKLYFSFNVNRMSTYLHLPALSIYRPARPLPYVNSFTYNNQEYSEIRKIHYLYDSYIVDSKGLYSDMCRRAYLCYDVATFIPYDFNIFNQKNIPRSVHLYHIPSGQIRTTYLSNYRTLFEYIGKFARKSV